MFSSRSGGGCARIIRLRVQCETHYFSGHWMSILRPWASTSKKPAEDLGLQKCNFQPAAQALQPRPSRPPYRADQMPHLPSLFAVDASHTDAASTPGTASAAIKAPSGSRGSPSGPIFIHPPVEVANRRWLHHIHIAQRKIADSPHELLKLPRHTSPRARVIAVVRTRKRARSPAASHPWCQNQPLRPGNPLQLKTYRQSPPAIPRASASHRMSSARSRSITLHARICSSWVIPGRRIHLRLAVRRPRHQCRNLALQINR